MFEEASSLEHAPGATAAHSILLFAGEAAGCEAAAGAGAAGADPTFECDDDKAKSALSAPVEGGAHSSGTTQDAKDAKDADVTIHTESLPVRHTEDLERRGGDAAPSRSFVEENGNPCALLEICQAGVRRRGRGTNPNRTGDQHRLEPAVVHRTHACRFRGAHTAMVKDLIRAGASLDMTETVSMGTFGDTATSRWCGI